MTAARGDIAVIIATKGRPQLVAQVVRALDRQSRRPDHIYVIGAHASDIVCLPQRRADCTVQLGRIGSAHQRNDAIRLADGAYRILVFFDDDFWPSRFWLENALALFDADPSIAGLTGRVLADGVGRASVTLAEARERVAARDEKPAGAANFDERFGPYGCNMAFRAEAMAGMEFDENLPLYAWLEDADFGERLRRRGRMGRVENLWGVHLGARAGRESGRRFGYSQIANAVYLARKGSLSWRFAARTALRNFASNLLRSAAPELYIDRRGRLFGNLLALGDLARGRVTPERAARL
ncbi:glycosyltransferase family A protein [Rhodoblastus sp.]|uniref:glycosyltransferase family A protein n=1 Tax=Rhodoblastus sp. TaxID=1962975 RepID=UPI003F9C9AA0